MIRDITRLIRWTIGRNRLERCLARQIHKAGVQIDGVNISDAGSGPARSLELQKKGRSVNIAINFRTAFGDPELTDVFLHRTAAIVDPFMRSTVNAGLGDISDGEESRSGTISFSTARHDAILIPDSLFYQSRGYTSFREASKSWRINWQARDEMIVWRGSTTGYGNIASDKMESSDKNLIQRTRMCLILQRAPRVDARFVQVVQSSKVAYHRRQLKRACILGGHIDPTTWLVRKFAIDIDGNSNAWSNLFTRLLAGCCVIKIASPFGYRQWYYDKLQPWHHFVPVAADLSDLMEKIHWCRAHDQRCSEIASAGRDFALRRDFATETNFAVETLNERLGAG